MSARLEELMADAELALHTICQSSSPAFRKAGADFLRETAEKIQAEVLNPTPEAAES